MALTGSQNLRKLMQTKNLARLAPRWVSTTSGNCSSLLKTVDSSATTRGEEFYAKNDRLKRPLSPHLTIYKFQMTSVLSITHRATGIVQSGLLYGFGLGTLVLPAAFPTYLAMVQGLQLGAPILFSLKFAIAWPFAYHLLNGVRHLCWDMGWGFQMPDLYKTGWTVVGLSFVLAAILASL